MKIIKFTTNMILQYLKQNTIVLLKRIIFATLLFLFCRLIFYILNLSYFKNLNFFDLIKLFFFGLRFDLSAIIYLNAIFILLSIIPGNFKYHKNYQLTVKFLFITVNSFAVLINLIDSVFFRFEGRRTTADILTPEWLGKDFLSLLPRFIVDFWYVPVMFILIILMIIKLYPRKPMFIIHKPYSFKLFLTETVFLILILGISFLGARGGIQLKPLQVMHAGQYTSSRNVSLVLNTPFTIMQTLQYKKLARITFYSKEELTKYYSPEKIFTEKENPKKKNIVIIILESCGKEYIGYFNQGKGYTPFLDSLLNKGLTFTYAYANGRRSIDAIPAIVAGLPLLNNQSFIVSGFSSNHINSIASLLKPYGYNSSFYHGCRNGSMGFDNFIKLAGFDEYFGLNEYPDKKDFDNHWGIFDEPYMHYFCKQLNTKTEPFISVLFTLSAHHPYNLPPEYNSTIPDFKHSLYRTIYYTDIALKNFFHCAQTQSWFANTLFVITADHTSLSENPYYSTKTGMFEIPLLFYCPQDATLKGTNSTIIQHSDILPTIIDYLGFSAKAVIFGNSAFDTTTEHFAVNYADGVYQLIDNNYLLTFTELNKTELFNLKNDHFLQKNISNEYPEIVSAKTALLKAIIQQYNNRLLDNKLHLE